MTKDEIQQTVDRDFEKLKSLYKTKENMFSILWKIEQAKQSLKEYYAEKRKKHTEPRTVEDVIKSKK